MAFSFEARIYKAGINPCVAVPIAVTAKMKAGKGYIPVKGKINGHPFLQTLVPVKGEGYRLYVNGPMMKGASVTVGDVAKFTIGQNLLPQPVPMPPLLKKALATNGLLAEFKALTPYRQKEIMRYLGFLKTKEALVRNIDKVTEQLKKKKNG